MIFHQRFVLCKYFFYCDTSKQIGKLVDKTIENLKIVAKCVSSNLSSCKLCCQPSFDLYKTSRIVSKLLNYSYVNILTIANTATT